MCLFLMSSAEFMQLIADAVKLNSQITECSYTSVTCTRSRLPSVGKKHTNSSINSTNNIKTAGDTRLIEDGDA